MKRFRFDSGIANLYMKEHPLVIQRSAAEVLAGHVIGLGSPILGELKAGIEGSQSRDRNLAELAKASRAWRVWPFDGKAAVEYGLIKAHLRKVGRKIQDIDIQLAAIAQTFPNSIIVTMDTDFTFIPDLKTENWTLP